MSEETVRKKFYIRRVMAAVCELQIVRVLAGCSEEIAKSGPIPFQRRKISRLDLRKMNLKSHLCHVGVLLVGLLHDYIF